MPSRIHAYVDSGSAPGWRVPIVAFFVTDLFPARCVKRRIERRIERLATS
jgi:hypothetical protein